MYLNIITPCSRPENLHQISKSINIPKEDYRWIVVFDSLTLPDKSYIPDNCEYYLHKDPNSKVGNAQRNFALDLVKTGHIYFNDDDTILHPELWDNIKDCDEDFISFKQSLISGEIRLTGKTIKVQHIDSHNFLLSNNLVGDTRWKLDVYEADGFFATECYEKVTRKKYIDKVLSIYNRLRYPITE
jgi:hypothetical protein